VLYPTELRRLSEKNFENDHFDFIRSTVTFYGRAMIERNSSKRREKTSQQNLVRHRSGRYYARLFHQGKEVWRLPKTEHFSVASARLAEKLREHEERKDIKVDTGDAKMTAEN
jgi:hypothetical protein